MTEVDLTSKDLVSVNAPLAVRGLNQPARWSMFGAALGVSATASLTLLPAIFSGSGVLAALLMSGMTSAAVVGAYLGRRWHRLVVRERGTWTVAQWLANFARDGALWGTAAAWGTLLPLAVAGAPLGELAAVLLAATVIAGSAGALVTSALGMSHILDLTRGEQPWKSLLMAFVLGPSAFVGVIIVLATVMGLFGFH